MRTGVGVLCELRGDLAGVLGDLVTPGELLFGDWLDLEERLAEDGDANCPLPTVVALVIGRWACATVLEALVFGEFVFGVIAFATVVFELLVFGSFVFTSFVFEPLVFMAPVLESSSFASTAFDLATFGPTAFGSSTFVSSGRTGSCLDPPPPRCSAKIFSNSSQEP